jgi:catechol 2,3-dioxygenase-like lactoylglutathione lyase family enzyme
MGDFPIIAIRSVEFGVPNPARAEEFYSRTWGLGVCDRNGEIVYLRATGNDHHVLALHPHARAEILSVSFRVQSEETLTRIAGTVTSAGGTVIAPVMPNYEPDGGVVLKISTPEGFVFRLHHGDAVLRDGAAQAGIPLRTSHVNLNCKDIEATTQFLQSVLGFKLTDRSKAMAFLRCNSDHHAVVLADSGVDGLNHVAFMMPDWESVMRGSGRMIDAGFPIGWGVGRHGPGNNVFAYFVDPFGFVIEYTAEVLEVDESYQTHGPEHWVWPSGRTDHWGIAPPKPESVKKAQLAIRFASPVARTSAEE